MKTIKRLWIQTVGTLAWVVYYVMMDKPQTYFEIANKLNKRYMEL